jgi:uncharacterized Rmd1/YagE family protein
MRCAAYCTAEKYDIDLLVKDFRERGFEPKFYDSVIHIVREDPSDEKNNADVFYFPHGCIVLWGMEQDEEYQFIMSARAFEVNPVVKITNEVLLYHYDETGGETRIDEEENTIILESDDPYIKLSISHGLSQSVVLDVFENSVHKTIGETKYFSEELSRNGRVSVSRNQLARSIGRLFAERNSINLHSDILDTPEFFWRRPRYEPYYLMASDSLDIKQRHNLLNKKLDVIHELYDKLSDELNYRHTSNLEVTIIVLISIEVLVLILRDILKWI